MAPKRSSVSGPTRDAPSGDVSLKGLGHPFLPGLVLAPLLFSLYIGDITANTRQSSICTLMIYKFTLYFLPNEIDTCLKRAIPARMRRPDKQNYSSTVMAMEGRHVAVDTSLCNKPVLS
ncbi:hypothetical protein J6590_030528 [Homalodisca vitripennis]|nr:hypothetical protein J6590_030528 [Homalodisca vitripennis]